MFALFGLRATAGRGSRVSVGRTAVGRAGVGEVEAAVHVELDVAAAATIRPGTLSLPKASSVQVKRHVRIR
ncbi:hypothetical protein [Actinomadura napierensis]|uniref:hypothetical protein n=1 Tax=Actinomadura napierensis TaxID=267854 RepID=UPI0031D75264